jgi:hypothetical protein
MAATLQTFATVLIVILSEASLVKGPLLVSVGYPPRELADGETLATAANDLAIRRDLELAGVEFIAENGGAARGAVSTSASGRNNPSKEWLVEIDGALGTGNSCDHYSTMTRDGRDLD